MAEVNYEIPRISRIFANNIDLGIMCVTYITLEFTIKICNSLKVRSIHFFLEKLIKKRIEKILQKHYKYFVEVFATKASNTDASYVEIFIAKF